MKYAVVDNDYSTAWTWNGWDTSIYRKEGFCNNI